MKHAALSLLFFSASFSTAVPAADGKVYRYFIDSYPGPASCPDTATQLRDEMKRQTGVGLISGLCAKTHGGRHDIELRYTAETRIEPVSTIQFSVGVPSSEQGTYDKAEDCERDLTVQRDLFRRETGLEPLVAYCYRESTEPRNSVVLRIDAFGKPAKNLFVVSRDLFANPVGDLDFLQGQLRRYAERKIDGLTSLVLRTVVLEHGIRTVAYGEKAVPQRVDRVGTYNSAAACLEAKGKSETKLATLPLPPPFLCGQQRFVGGYALLLYQVKVGTFLELVPYPALYPSLAACDADAENASKEVSASVGLPAVAFVCQEKGRQFSGTVLVERRP